MTRAGIQKEGTGMCGAHSNQTVWKIANWIHIYFAVYIWNLGTFRHICRHLVIANNQAGCHEWNNCWTITSVTFCFNICIGSCFVKCPWICLLSKHVLVKQPRIWPSRLRNQPIELLWFSCPILIEARLRSLQIQSCIPLRPLYMTSWAP